MKEAKSCKKKIILFLKNLNIFKYVCRFLAKSCCLTWFYHRANWLYPHADWLYSRADWLHSHWEVASPQTNEASLNSNQAWSYTQSNIIRISIAKYFVWDPMLIYRTIPLGWHFTCDRWDKTYNSWNFFFICATILTCPLAQFLCYGFVLLSIGGIEAGGWTIYASDSQATLGNSKLIQTWW